MSELLKAGKTMKIRNSGEALEVEQFLGGGGQGEVYRVNANGSPMALKWYFRHAATDNQKTTLEDLIRVGPPNDKFLWPLHVIEAEGVNGFGYVMKLREPHYKSIVDLMKRRIEPTFKAIATAGYELSDSFLQLHSKGLCYRDISFGNVFFNANTGEILICDNDNVTIDHANSDVGVLGTPRFMAPEVVTGKAKPSTTTDLFSLAVLLFYMLMVHHPLEGERESSIKCLDLPAMNKLYGTDPVFIFDPKDTSNQPVKGLHDNAIEYWPLYPRFIQRLFTRSFTEGIHDPDHGRVRESEWRAAMIKLRDSVVYCSCGMENFYDLDALKEQDGNPGQCWSCDKQIQYPPRIKIGDNVVMLNHDTQLYPHHCSEKLYDFSAPFGEVVQNPKNPSVWGLKNTSSEKWVSVARDNKVSDVEPGRSVTLAVGTKINFGGTEGEIRL